jgi:enoyl-CoA hydratase
MAYELLMLERHEKVGLIRLNRPEALNALSLPLRRELAQALAELDAEETIGALVITGSDKAFAAGADVKALSGWSYMDVSSESAADLRTAWDQMQRLRKPIIAAVAGFALGAGCELAMMCDFILAADNARFGQPEIKLGTIPGAGGTQRLTRLIGKNKAMEMILTGRMMNADEAERCGLVARIIPLAELVDEAMRVATLIAELSAPVVRLARDAVSCAYETALSEGLRYEARLFESTFALDDRREGMLAFLEKRKPQFRNC